jgi:YVTN family beta-propeller protein
MTGNLNRLLLFVFFFSASVYPAQGQIPKLIWQPEGPVTLRSEGPLEADFDDDGVVGFSDFLLFARSFSAREGEAAYDARMDLNGDGAIDFSDFVSFGAAYGARSDAATSTRYAVYVLDPLLGGAAIFDSESYLLSDYLRFRGPTGIAVSADEQTIFVSEGFGLFAINANHEALFSIPTESQGRIVLSPDERFAYVTEERHDRLVVLDLVARVPVDTISVGQRPIDVAILPNGKKLYVANADSRDISVIDVDRRENVGGIIIGAVPGEIGITTDGGRAYVTNINRGIVSVLDLNSDQVAGGIQLSGDSARGLAFSPDGQTLYVASSETRTGGFLVAIDVRRNLISRRLRVGDAASTIGVSPDGSRLYIGTLVLDGGGPGLSAVDLNDWRVMGRLLGIDFIAQFAFRTLSQRESGRGR